MVMAPAVDSHTSSLMSSGSTSEWQTTSKPSFGQSSSSPPSFDIPSFNNDFELDSWTVPNTKAEPTKTTTATTIAETEVDKRPKPSLLRSKTTSFRERPRSWIPGAKRSKDVTDNIDGRPSTTEAGTAVRSSWAGLPAHADVRPAERSLRSSDSFANFAKRSWLTSSRSPSPRRTPTASSDSTEVEGRERGSNQLQIEPVPLLQDHGRNNTKDSAEAPVSPRSTTAKKPPKTSSYFSKMRSKPQPVMVQMNDVVESDNSCASSVASITKHASNSCDARSSHSTYRDSTSTADDSASDAPPRGRDPLWSSFKVLETDIKGSLLNHTSPRVAHIQTTVLPFLRGTMYHESVKNLRPQDLDRRANILNKWWDVVLDMLEGHGQPVPGVDRPVLMETATMIMMRPEWRQLTTSFQALAERQNYGRVRRRSGTTSSDSSVSSEQAAFLLESVEHNVRTMFVSSLTRQAGFVVEKMSQRHAPLSLVNFAGKTCAYAFFFAPVVGDILVRLWGLSPEHIRRASDGLGMPRKSKRDAVEVGHQFPACLEGLVWSSPKETWDYMKQIPALSMLLAQIPWTGPWVSRWKGKDTDLFFIFCKYFFILTEEFCPKGTPLPEKGRSPGFVLVQAQLLSIIDATVHRQAALEGAFGQPSAIDGDTGMNASALAMPLPPLNLLKSMAENRLVVLLKHLLRDESANIGPARHTFAESLACLLKAAATRTSQFNHAACLTLCDFIEEIISIADDAESSVRMMSYIDWPFWVEVLKRMLDSSHTMSEIRVFCILYTTWDSLTRDHCRKKAVCLDWLLREEIFERFFNHWCPMVRAYYHRLICWRICREDANPSEVDSAIFSTAATRLRSVWAHYLYLKQTAEDNKRLPPSTAAMLPTPNKKFIIIRHEVHSPPPGLFVGFDGFAKFPSASERMETGLPDTTMLAPKGDSKKRWSLLGKVLSMTAGNIAAQPLSKMTSRSSSWDEGMGEGTRDESGVKARRNSTPPSKFGAGSTDGGETDSRSSSPVAEEQKHAFKFFLSWHQVTKPPPERVLGSPRLPRAAHTRVCHGQHGKEGKQDSVLDASCSGGQRGVEEDEETGLKEPVTRPKRPTGAAVKGGVYTGRALAEWTQVVFECDSFTDRRCEECAVDSYEVEVPTLSIEGFRKLGG